MNIEKDIFIPVRVPSLNKWKGCHWRSYSKIKKQWLDLMNLYAPHGGHGNCLRYMEIILYHKSKKGFYDRDNCIGGCKPLLDAIKGTGWIKDDSPKWVDCGYHQNVVGEHKGITAVGTRILFYKQEALSCRIYCRGCFLKSLESFTPNTTMIFRNGLPCSCGLEGLIQIIE